MPLFRVFSFDGEPQTMISYSFLEYGIRVISERYLENNQTKWEITIDEITHVP